MPGFISIQKENGTPLKGHCLHHIDPSWKHDDPVRYAEWRVEDLVMLTRSEHARLHMTDLLTDERRQNMSKPRHGGWSWSDEAKANLSLVQKKRFEDPSERAKISGENNGKFGKKWDKEHLKLFSEMNKGKNNPMFGKTFTEEQKLKISEGIKNSQKFKEHIASRTGKKNGKKWFTNEVDSNVYATDCPEGYRPGRIMFGYTAWNKGMKKNVD